MKKFEVVIKIKITKTYTVEAESESEAEATALDICSVLNDGVPEDYDQEIVETEEITT